MHISEKHGGVSDLVDKPQIQIYYNVALTLRYIYLKLFNGS